MISEEEFTKLREEVMAPGVRYEDLIEDDQLFVNQGAVELAKERGISLD